MSAQAVTVRLQRVSQLRALCLSLAAAGRRAGLAPHSAGQQVADSERSGPADERWAEIEAALAESEPAFPHWAQATAWIRDRTSSTPTSS